MSFSHRSSSGWLGEYVRGYNLRLHWSYAMNWTRIFKRTHFEWPKSSQFYIAPIINALADYHFPGLHISEDLFYQCVCLLLSSCPMRVYINYGSHIEPHISVHAIPTSTIERYNLQFFSALFFPIWLMINQLSVWFIGLTNFSFD